ncbi:MAG: stage V sporulation protein D [Clostridia bacterium]|nr:stage V sporulation protein D [Clostridia bacterium]
MFAVTFLFSAIIGRVFYVQVIWGKELQSKAIDQWTRELPIAASRGEIVDRNGVVLAGNSQSYAVFVRPRSVKDPQKVSDTLATALGIDEKKLYDKITSGGVSEITVAKKTTKETIEKLEEYDLSGVYFSADNTRVYPYGNMLCQIMGYVSSDGSGQTGLEKRYDEYLKGYDGEILYEADLIGKDIEGKTARYISATDGLNVKLTIDYEIQQICESVMAEAVDEYSPKSASAIVLEPSSGKILAISQAPSFDLNAVPRDDLETLNKLGRSAIISDSYEPGSTFKILTAAANIEEYLSGNLKAFSLNYVFNPSRFRYVGGRAIKCWSTHANGKHANETLAEALNNSCNPCFVDIALSLGREKMYSYINAFNYGKATGVDFDGEAIGMLIPENSVTDGDLARISFGQTIAVTPLQLAAATCAAVNGGIYYEPYFVSEIYDNKGNIAEIINPKQKRRVISEKASAILSGYLENVVKIGSGKQAYIEGYKVGGKTGTAQKYENGVIAAGKYVMSFVGFFPANKPEYLALCVIDEPVGGQYGSTVAAPLIRKIFDGIIRAKNIKRYEAI